MIYHTPKFLYSGSKKWGIPSDRVFIEKKFQRLNAENQKIVSDMYDEIYRKHFNKGELSLARDNANRALVNFVNEYGISLKEYQHLKAANDDQDWVKSQVERLKLAQRVAKPKIEFKERRRA